MTNPSLRSWWIVNVRWQKSLWMKSDPEWLSPFKSWRMPPKKPSTSLPSPWAVWLAVKAENCLTCSPPGKILPAIWFPKRLPTLWVCWKSMLPWGSSLPHRQPAHPVLFQVSFWHFRKNMISPMTRSSTHSSPVLPLAILPCSMQPLPVPSAVLPQWPLPLLSSWWAEHRNNVQMPPQQCLWTCWVLSATRWVAW